MNHKSETPRLLLPVKVRQHLADDIASGRLPPGTKLDEVEVARRFAVSRTPVREAFRLLANTGLVTNEPHKGVTVAWLSAEALAGLYEALAEVAGVLARMAAARLSADERESLRQRLPGMTEAEFDDEIARAAGNPVLADLAAMLRGRLQPYRRLAEEGDRDQVAQAVVDGDGEAAQSLLKDRILEAARVAADQYPSTSPTAWTPVAAMAALRPRSYALPRPG